MKLASIEIQNFRGLSNLRFSVTDFMSLIGPNNSGKSTALLAVERLLTNKPFVTDDWPKNAQGEPADPSSRIIISGVLTGVTEAEGSLPGVSGCVDPTTSEIHLRLIVEMKSGKPERWYEVFVESAVFEGLAPRLADCSDEVKAFCASNKIVDGVKGITPKNREKIESFLEQAGKKSVAKGWTSDHISIGGNALQQALPQVVLVPAVRDASDEASGGKSAFGQLLERVVLPALKETSEFKDLKAAAAKLQKAIHEASGGTNPVAKALSAEITAKLQNLVSAQALVSMAVPDIDKIVASTVGLQLSDGVPTSVAAQGHGLQRTLVFALLEVLAQRVVKAPQATEESLATGAARGSILLFEEPELFMHPHLMRRLRENLRRISGQPDWQVILTTHAPTLVDVARDPRSLVILRKTPAEPGRVVQVASDPFAGGKALEAERRRLRAAIDFHPSVCEAFFATNVVLVEGDSEVAILQHGERRLYERAGIGDKQLAETSIVSCGGKWTIIPIARLLKAFGVPFRVIHDRDRKTTAEAKLAASRIHPFHANAKIAEIAGTKNLLVSADCLEDALGLKRWGKKDKPFRAWKYARHVAKRKGDLPAYMRAFLRFAFLGEQPVQPVAPTLAPMPG